MQRFVRAAVGLATALAAPAQAHLEVYRVEMLAFNDGSSGWRFEIGVEGSEDLASVSVTPPGRGAIALLCEPVGVELVECGYDDPSPPAAGYGSLATLLSVFPAGSYALSVNSGVRTATLAFDPVAPTGDVTVISPPAGSSDVSPTPAVDYSHDCDNCNYLGAELADPAGTFALESFGLGVPPLPSPGSIAYGDLDAIEGSKPAQLPDGEYRLIAFTGVGSMATVNFDNLPISGVNDFEYTDAVQRETEGVFTVPEPGTGAAAALAALAALVRRRR